MKIYSFLPILFALAYPLYLFALSYGDSVERDNYTFYTGIKIDLWELLILLQRLIVLFYKILEKFFIMKNNL